MSTPGEQGHSPAVTGTGSTRGRAPRPNRRRWLRVSVAVVAVLFLSVLALHTAPAKKAVATILTKWVHSRVGIEVTLGQLDYQLWRGQATIVGLRTAGRGVDITSERIDVRFGPGTGLEVRAVAPRMHVSLARSRASQPTAVNPRPWLSLLRFARIEVVHGSIDVVDADGRSGLTLDGIDALVTRTPGGAGGTLRVNAAAAGPAEGPRVERVGIDATVEIRSDTGTLVIQSARLRAAGSDLHAQGELSGTTPLAMRARFEGTVASTLVTAALPKQRIEIPGSHPIAIRGRLENDRLVADAIETEMFGGLITARGTMSLSNRDGDFALVARNLDVREVSNMWSSPAIASRLDAELGLRMSDWKPESLSGSGTLAFRSQQGRGLPVDGGAQVGWNGRALTWGSERLMVRDVAVKLDGQLSAEGDISARYTAHIPAIDRLRPVLADLGVQVSPLPLTGSASAAGTLAGRLPEVALSLRVTSDDVTAYGVRAAVESDVRMTRSGVEIVSLLARGAEVEARAAGVIPLQPDGQWNVTGDLQRLNLSGLLADRGIAMHANASGSFAIDGARSKPAVRIERSAATVAGGTIALSGSWHPESGVIEGRVEAAHVDVQQLDPLVPHARELATTLALTADISGSLSAPSGRAHVTLTEPRLRGITLPDATLDLSSDGRVISVAGLLGDRSFLSGQGGVGGGWPLDVKVDLASLPTDDVARMIPMPAGGIADVSVAGQANIHLLLQDPSSFEYQSEISQLGLRATRDWRAGPFSASGNRDHFSIRGLDFRSGESRVTVDGGLGFTAESGAMTVNANAPLADFAWLLPGVEAKGQADVNMRITGSIAAPVVDGRIALRDGSLHTPAVQVDQIEIEAIAEQSVLNIRNATARVAGGEARVTGALPLVSGSGDRPRQVDFTLRGLDLATFAGATAEHAKLSIPADLDGRVTLSAFAVNAIEAHGALTRLSVIADAERQDLEAPVSWTFERGTLAHTPLRIQGPRGHATLSATLTSAGDGLRFSAQGTGTLDLSIANPFLADTGVAGGTLTFDARVARSQARWTMGGSANLVDGRLVLRSPQLALTDVRASLRADGDRVELVEATAVVGDGKIVARGQAAITNHDLDLDLRVEADRVPLEHPEGLRTRSSGVVQVSGTAARPHITGDLVVNRAVYERELDRTAKALDLAGAKGAAPASRGALADRTELELTLRPEDGLRIATDTATLVIDGTLRVVGTVATPEVDGSLSVREGGTVRVSRALVRLQGGRIELRGFPSRPPEIEIQGVTQVTGVRIDVGLSGSLDDVRMNLSSSNRSDLSQGDLATLILTGRTTSEAAADSGAIVVEEVAAALGQALDRQLGGAVMIDVSRDESLIVEDTNPSQRLNIGVPLNSRLYVIYSRSLDHEALRWIVDFKPGGDFRLRAIANDDASEAVEVSHRFGFNAWSRKYLAPAAKTRASRSARSPSAAPRLVPRQNCASG